MMVSRPRSSPQRELASSPSLGRADLKQGLCQRRTLDQGADALLACAACRGPIRERFYLQARAPVHVAAFRAHNFSSCVAVEAVARVSADARAPPHAYTPTQKQAGFHLRGPLQLC
ncbi:uncharacterized protein LOC142585533 [Dermacentor variabilis]|uniref:uncharacterized protein LOC142585533 n=1 Tax=Dermacentor variabilis TaxID=34621 RepID=UPI003F5AE3A0